MKSPGKNFNDYLVLIPHFTNEKTEAQRRDLHKSHDELGSSRNMCLPHPQLPDILEAPALLCLSPWVHPFSESSHTARHTMGFMPSNNWLTFFSSTWKHWVYSSIFVHLDGIAVSSLNMVKLLGYYVKTTHFWERFFLRGTSRRRSLRLLSYIPPVRALVE